MVFRRFVSGILRKAGVIFVPLYENKKISSGFAQDASLQVVNTIWVGGSSHNWGRRCGFLIFARMEICLKS